MSEWNPALRALCDAAWAVLEGDDPCPECRVEPSEGAGYCQPGCRRNDLVMALVPLEAWRREVDGGAD